LTLLRTRGVRPPDERRAGKRRAVLRRSHRLTPDLAVAAVLGALVFWVHDVAYNLRAPFWTDESWVVVSTKMALSELPGHSASTPVGWTFLLRAVFFGGEQRYRLLPLVFAALAVAAGYLFGRALGWRTRSPGIVAGVLVAVSLLLQPAALVRNDVKQYTADAFTAVLVLALTARLEGSWSRRRLAALGVAIVLGMLVSHTTAIVGAAALLALGLTTLLQRHWHRLVDLTVAAAATGAGMVAVYVAFDRRAVVPALTSFWRDYFPPTDRGVDGVCEWFTMLVRPLEPLVGLGGNRWLLLVLVVAGLATLCALRRPAVALAVPLVVVVAFALAATGVYPLLDQRTSHYLFAVAAVTIAVGAAGVCVGLARLAVRSRVNLAGPFTTALAVATILWYAHANAAYVRTRSPFTEDVRSQVAHVAAHRSPGDVILVNSASNWNFGYYWSLDRPQFKDTTTNAAGFVVTYPTRDDIVVCEDRTVAVVRTCFDAALGRASQRQGARVWLVRSHVNASEQKAWQAALSGVQTHPILTGDADLIMVSARG